MSLTNDYTIALKALTAVIGLGDRTNVVTPVQSLKIYAVNKTSPAANTINTYLQLRNEGNVSVNYADIRLRYYFTSEGMQLLNFYFALNTFRFPTAWGILFHKSYRKVK
ncbi:hypothetical protein IC229_12525 [Spirosoma sp. BT702]|uniref:CBM3 domain-containing protein n=1 Tax=Spirosoma profusum TaxID=2771354 RepID=A0A926XVN2_9BACT|nr:cellulose binding domain-containing protein [Spirosoma profusum]MBD2701468.1 hypothetical protein [Spirosoma profusum]